MSDRSYLEGKGWNIVAGAGWRRDEFRKGDHLDTRWAKSIQRAIDAAVAEENKRLRSWLEAIRDDECDEIVYDQFAYDRRVGAFKKAASDALEAMP